SLLDESRQPELWHLAQQPNMVVAERSGPDHTNARWVQIATPRWLDSTNCTSCITSGICSTSAVTRSIACARLSSDRNNSLYARFNSRIVSAENPFRRSPTEFSPYNFIGLPTALTNGGTSFDTREQPPTIALRPIRVNW